MAEHIHWYPTPWLTFSRYWSSSLLIGPFCSHLSPLPTWGEQQLWRTTTWGEGERREEEREGGWVVGKRGGRESKCPVGNRTILLGLLLSLPLAFYRCLFPAFPPFSILVAYPYHHGRIHLVLQPPPSHPHPHRALSVLSSGNAPQCLHTSPIPCRSSASLPVVLF